MKWKIKYWCALPWKWCIGITAELRGKVIRVEGDEQCDLDKAPLFWIALLKSFRCAWVSWCSSAFLIAKLPSPLLLFHVSLLLFNTVRTANPPPQSIFPWKKQVSSSYRPILNSKDEWFILPIFSLIYRLNLEV